MMAWKGELTRYYSITVNIITTVTGFSEIWWEQGGNWWEKMAQY